MAVELSGLHRGTGGNGDSRTEARLDEAAVHSAVSDLTVGLSFPTGAVEPGTPGIVGVGVDLVELARMATVLDRTPSFGQRVFTEAEYTYCTSRRDPTERFAARFAAKEAVLKAMGLGLWAVPLTAIEVVRDEETGAPFVFLHGAAGEAADECGISSWRLSITHTDRVAVAVALALGAAERDRSGREGK